MSIVAKKEIVEEAVIKEEKVKETKQNIQEEVIKPKQKEEKTEEEKDFSDKIKDEFDNVKDDSKKYTEKDKRDGKIFSILAYLGILCLIPFFAEKNNKYVQFHAKEGLNLFLYDLIAEVVCGFLGTTIILLIPALIVAWLVRVANVAFMIIGIINVCNDKAKELPYIGKYKIIK